MSFPQSNRQPWQLERPSQPPTFPLTQKPEKCFSNEHMVPALIDRHTANSRDSLNIKRPYYFCTNCDNHKTNVYRNSGYPRGFVTWDDSIGIDARNPKCYCGFPSRQDRKGEKGYWKGFEGGFWVCALGGCHYYSDGKDGIDYEDAKKRYDFDDFKPFLLEGVPRFF